MPINQFALNCGWLKYTLTNVFLPLYNRDSVKHWSSFQQSLLNAYYVLDILESDRSIRSGQGQNEFQNGPLVFY